jgi:ABC-type polar amino acid transport system ATPase subunit
MISDALISLRNVGKSYTTHSGSFAALRNINLDIGRGEFVGIVGHSGSGKSTLLNLLSGIDRATIGELFVDGVALHAMREGAMAKWRGRSVGIVFQFFQLLPTLTAIENVMLPMDLCTRWPARERDGRARALLEQLGVADQAHKLPATLSGGQQQRVAIARALAMKPALMLFDEATSALDPEMIGEVLDVMRELARDGMTMIVVTHEMGFAREVGERVLMMDDGAIVEEGSPAELFTNPRNERTQSFLSKIIH